MAERNEQMAHALLAQLRAVGVDACVRGGGVHWQVDAGVDASHTVRVHCFWYQSARSGSTPAAGPRPSNARAMLDSTPRAHEGPQYLVILYAQGVQIAEGRTPASQQVVACVRGWLAELEIEPLVCEVPFIAAGPRAMQAIAQRLDRRLQWRIGPGPAYRLWVSGEGRRCEVRDTGDAVACSFLVGPQQVAYHPAPEDLPAAVTSWLVERVPVGELTVRVPGVELERHAEVLERDSARWHWLHVLDRIAEPDDVLAPLRELIQALSESAVATRFYSYSSLGWFCFSASSHFVWVNDGLPEVAPDDHGRVRVNDAPCDLRDAVQRIEEILAGHPIRPFFGSAADHDLPLLTECLAQERSELRPFLVPRGRFTDLVVEDPAGQRRCTVIGTSITFDTEARRTSASWPTRPQAARAIRRYCEAREPAADIIADPATVTVARDGVPIKGSDL